MIGEPGNLRLVAHVIGHARYRVMQVVSQSVIVDHFI